MNRYLKNPSQSELSLEDAKRKYLPRAVPCPRCKRSPEQLSWFYFASKGGWVTFCDRCDSQVDFFIERQEYYSWQEVNVCRYDKHFQSKHAQEDAKREYLWRAAPCPKCKNPAEKLSWFYAGDSARTPETEGWMTACDKCVLQVDFFIERREYYPWEQVNALRDNKDLQSQHQPERSKTKHLQKASPCPRCGTLPAQLSWALFADSKQTPEYLIVGWMVVCGRCNIQTDFFEESRQRQYSWERVNECRNDMSLQGQYPLEDVKRESLKRPAACPICRTPGDQLSCFYFDDHPVPPGWLSVCDKCSVQVELIRDSSAAYYSWRIVNSVRNDRELQNQQSLHDAREHHLETAKPCPECSMPAAQLSWFYYSSLGEDWRALAGRAGWMTVCDKCRIQVDFFVEVLS